MVKKRVLMTVLIIFLVLLQIVGALFVLTLPWSLIYVGLLFSPNPPKPEITYGEFPFELVYEIDGKTVTVNDVYVCEFDGFGINEGVGKYREWKGYVKSTKEEHVILVQEDNLQLCFVVGSPEYYMSDPDNKNQEESYTPIILADIFYENGIHLSTANKEKINGLMEQYKIEIVSWKFSDPIENTYK